MGFIIEPMFLICVKHLETIVQPLAIIIQSLLKPQENPDICHHYKIKFNDQM